MKMKFLALTTLVLIGTSFISGCNNSSSENKERNSTKIDGKYIELDNYYLCKNNEYMTDFDSAINNLNSDESSITNIILDDSEFEISLYGYTTQQKYSGTINNDDELKFNYQECFLPATKTIDFMTGQEISNNETIVNINENYDELNESAKKVRCDEMKRLNETGSFVNPLLPSAYDSSMDTFNVIPFCITRDMKLNAESPTMLKHNDDFLCIDVYGMKLDSKYKYGNDFTIKFDVLAPYVEDKYSVVNISEDKEVLEKIKMNLKNSITDNSDDFNTTIKFSDGKWEWYNSIGNLVNNGEYQESKQHKGFIEMYIANSSKFYHSSYDDPLLLYINHKGDIYYPAFIKFD